MGLPQTRLIRFGLQNPHSHLTTNAPIAKNTVLVSDSTSYSLSDATSIGVDYRYAQQASVTGSEQKDASIYTSHRLSDDLYLRGYVMQGFTDSSADNGVGLSVSLTY